MLKRFEIQHQDGVDYESNIKKVGNTKWLNDSIYKEAELAVRIGDYSGTQFYAAFDEKKINRIPLYWLYLHTLTVTLLNIERYSFDISVGSENYLRNKLGERYDDKFNIYFDECCNEIIDSASRLLWKLNSDKYRFDYCRIEEAHSDLKEKL